jgi:hypothetical protein
MKTNDRNRDDHSSKQGTGKTAVLPTADSPNTAQVTAPPRVDTAKTDQRDLAGKSKEVPATKGDHANSAGKSSGGHAWNPGVKR